MLRRRRNEQLRTWVGPWRRLGPNLVLHGRSVMYVCRSENAGDTTSLVASENKETRINNDQVAPYANGADKGRPSRSGAQGYGETIVVKTRINLEYIILEN